ncbi:MAG: 50S ribosomal protein L4 [Deltaproteobacteria bacterium]|nr:50S ribosomal protein L4 [Deltaproteobacteria bacterium]
MVTIDVYNTKKEKVSAIDLSDDVFDVPIKEHVLHEVIRSQLLERRAGTASVKGRSEVKSSGRKLWRQKGTGRARVGDASSPARRGGGVTFGPAPRSYSRRIPKRVKKLALRMALTDKLRNDQLVVLKEFDLPEIKTKKLLEVMEGFQVRKALIVTDGKNENLEKSSRNVPWVKVMRYEGLNPYDLLSHEHLFMVQSAVPKIEEALVS